MKRFGISLLAIAFALFLFTSCEHKTQEPHVKYAFLFIGDGMGQAQVNTAQAYRAVLENKQGFMPLTFTQFPAMGWASTHANNRLITGSAAAGTALATGHKTNISYLSVAPDGTTSLETIAEKAKKAGLKTGIVTSVSIDHATPAAFYAHQPRRSNYFEIGMELASSNMDFFGGGGFKEPIKVVDGDTLRVIEQVLQNGYTLVNTLQDFNNLTKGSGKVLAIAPNLADGASMPYMIDGNKGNPSLADFTQKAIDLLEDSEGFFIVVEGGKIDWAGHGNDAATNVLETLAFADAVAVAKAFYDQHPNETIIVVTADHETGGLALGNAGLKYKTNLGILAYQQISSDGFNEKLTELKQQLSGDLDHDFSRMMELVSIEFGMGDTTKIPMKKTEWAKLKVLFEESIQKPGEQETLTYGSNEQITSLLIELMSNKAGLGWTSSAHTGINVPVFAIGPGSEMFVGMLDNTDIPKNMERLLGID